MYKIHSKNFSDTTQQDSCFLLFYSPLKSMAMIVTYTHYFSLFMYILPRWSSYVYTQLLFPLKISSERRLLSCVHTECLHQHQCWCSEWISWIPIVLFSDTCHVAWKRVLDQFPTSTLMLMFGVDRPLHLKLPIGLLATSNSARSDRSKSVHYCSAYCLSNICHLRWLFL